MVSSGGSVEGAWAGAALKRTQPLSEMQASANIGAAAEYVMNRPTIPPIGLSAKFTSMSVLWFGDSQAVLGSTQ
jgi:hypothetical protein